MNTMTAEQQRIAAAKQVNMNRPMDQVLELLRALVAFDETTAGKRKRAGISIALAIVMAIIAFTISGKTHGTTSKIAIAAGVLSVVGFVAASVFYARFRSADLSDNLSVAAVPFLVLLREDMNPSQPLHLRIDLTSWKASGKKKKESEPYKAGAYYKVIDRLFVDPWFSGNTVLADGTRVGWEVVEHVFERTRTKKNPRGKIKTKTKAKRRTHVTVSLGFPSKQYAATGEDVKSDEKRQSMRLRRKAKSEGEESMALPMLVDLIAEGYRRVAIAKGA
jgi:hypothetical protein